MTYTKQTRSRKETASKQTTSKRTTSTSFKSKPVPKPKTVKQMEKMVADDTPLTIPGWNSNAWKSEWDRGSKLAKDIKLWSLTRSELEEYDKDFLLYILTLQEERYHALLFTQYLCKKLGLPETNEPDLLDNEQLIQVILYIKDHISTKARHSSTQDGAIWDGCYECDGRLHFTFWYNPSPSLHPNGYPEDGYPMYPHTVSIGFDDLETAMGCLAKLYEFEYIHIGGLRDYDWDNEDEPGDLKVRNNTKKTTYRYELKLWNMAMDSVNTLVKLISSK